MLPVTPAWATPVLLDGQRPPSLLPLIPCCPRDVHARTRGGGYANAVPYVESSGSVTIGQLSH